MIKAYLDKQCPAEGWVNFCSKLMTRIGAIFSRDEAVWCPMCRHGAPLTSGTIVQVEHSRNEALTMIKGQINRAMRTDALNFNRRQPRGGFLSMSMDVKGGTSSHLCDPPAQAAEPMQLEIQCESCRARFAVIGSAFLPRLRFNSVIRTFNDLCGRFEQRRTMKKLSEWRL